MSELPSNWKSIEIPFQTPSQAIYGYTHDLDEVSYQIFVTNFKSVWSERVDKKALITKAGAFGFEDLASSTIRDLLRLIERSIDQNFTIARGKPKEIINFKIDSDDVKWTFELKQLSPEATIEFLAQLNSQQFINHQVLLNKLGDLQRIIDIKDTYIKFLAENFKLSHGLDLISDYKKNNKHVTEHLDPFNESKWLKRFEVEHVGSSNPDAMQAALNDTSTWNLRSTRSRSPIRTQTFNTIENSSDNSPFYTSPIKGGPSSTPAESSQFQHIPHNEREEIEEETINGSPPRKKAKKLGFIKKRNPVSSQTSQRESIPPLLYEKWNEPILSQESSAKEELDSSPIKKKSRFGRISKKK